MSTENQLRITLDRDAIVPDPDRAPVEQEAYGIKYSVIDRGELRTMWEIMTRSLAACAMAAKDSHDLPESCSQCHLSMLHVYEGEGKWRTCEAKPEDFDDCDQLNWTEIESEAASIIMETLNVNENELRGMWTRKKEVAE